MQDGSFLPKTVYTKLLTPSKHKTSGYATISFENICKNCLLLHSKQNGTEYEFADVDTLLAGGWAID
jgi:hypothetical protein